LGPALGSLLAPAITGLSLLISVWCNSNKTSMIVSLGAYLLLMLPAEFGYVTPLPGGGAPTPWTAPLDWVNPMAAIEWVLRGHIIAGTPLESQWTWLAMPLLVAVAIPAILFIVGGRAVRLDAAKSRLGSVGARWGRLAGVSSERARPARALPERLPEPSVALRGRDAPLGAFRSRPRRTLQSRGGPPAWWVVCCRELRELWIGGRALVMLLVYTVIVGVASFSSARSSHQDLIPPKELVYTIVQICMYVTVCIGVIIGADSLSGARERAALEPLLLTPASRRQIVIGKFLAGVSPLPAAMAVAVPCLGVLAQGDPVFGLSLLWVGFLGGLVVLGFTALAMLVSCWSNSNKTSLFVSLTLFLLFFLPALLPGRAQKGLVGKFFQRANPLAAADQLLERMLVNNNSFHDYQSWLRGPVWFLILVMVLLFLFAAPRLRLFAGRARA
jgi:ABC-2 type transport system permease protein